MGADVERYLELLRKEVEELGTGGGLAEASIYDTAQVLRHAPDPVLERRQPIIRWLLEQQQVKAPQGEGLGWGKPGVSPLAQSVPTMAALLALHEYLVACAAAPQEACPPELRKKVEHAVRSGLDFMQGNARAWAAAVPLPDDIPVAAELILPMLLDDAPKDWKLPQEHFQVLRELGARRRGLIARFKPGPDSTAAHAWETWGVTPEERWLVHLGDRITPSADGSVTARLAVGHSPSATALWLKKKREEFRTLHGDDSGFDSQDFVKKIQNYLADSTASTGTGVPGTYPTCYPIDRWEQIWGLLSLFETGLLSAPELKTLVERQLADVDKALKKEGIGLSDYFICDGDDTAAALTVLLAAKPDDAELRKRAEALQARFARDGQFTTYPHELQPSLTTTAHWMLVLKLLGANMSASVELVKAAQKKVDKEQQKTRDSYWEGLWLVDKWNCSWLYATSQSMIALEADPNPASDAALLKAMHRLIELQDASDGSWGSTRGTSTETAFGARSLLCLRERPAFKAFFGKDGVASRALRKAAGYLARHVDAPPEQKGATYWIDKEPFATPRLDRAYELSSLIALARAGYLDT